MLVRLPAMDRRAAFHGFEDWQAEALEIRRIDETDGPAVERIQLLVGDVSSEANVAARFIALSGLHGFVFKPTALSGQNKRWKLTLWMQSAQEGIRLDQSPQILSGLNRTKRQNVVTIDAVSFSDPLQFCFIVDPLEHGAPQPRALRR
jgi:hypothetical protein